MRDWNAKPFFALAIFFCLHLPVVQAQVLPKQIKAEQTILQTQLAKSDVEKNLNYLCDVIGPRLTGSPSLRRANEWTAKKMKEYGLTNVHEEAWLMPEGWQRGYARARLIEPANGTPLAIASMGWRPGTNGKVTGPVVAITARNSEELQKYKGKLKDAIVLLSPPVELVPLAKIEVPPKEISIDIARAYLTGKNAKNAPEITGAFKREVERFVLDEGAAVTIVDAGKHFGLLFTTGGFGSKDRPSAINKMPVVSMSHGQYAMLYRLATRPEPSKTTMEIDVQNTFIPGPIAVYNTIGEIRGSEKPDEFVILGAHLDSWDLGQGATDNGSGTTVVLEAARLLAKCGMQPKRTIRFVLFTGEEQGLHGSRAYVRKHKAELKKISAALVHDTGTGKVIGLVAAAGHALNAIEKETPALAELGIGEFSNRSFGASDHYPFEQAGIPGILFRQEIAGYRFSHHSQADTVDRVNEDNLLQGAKVMAITALQIANREELLPRALGGRRNR